MITIGKRVTLATWLLVFICLVATAATPARADMLLSQVIVDLGPAKTPSDDIEIWNTGGETLYLLVEPVEIISPGLADERRVAEPNPEHLGLLVTPNKLIVEPGQRKRVRVAAIVPRGPVDRIYRIAVKPVVGVLAAEQSALKILVGYDVLVILRPEQPVEQVTAVRSGRSITFHNGGNTNVELFDGRQCDAAGQDCRMLPGKRLYAGAHWQQMLPHDTPADYSVKLGDRSVTRRF